MHQSKSRGAIAAPTEVHSTRNLTEGPTTENAWDCLVKIRAKGAERTPRSIERRELRPLVPRVGQQRSCRQAQVGARPSRHLQARVAMRKYDRLQGVWPIMYKQPTPHFIHAFTQQIYIPNTEEYFLQHAHHAGGVSRVFPYYIQPKQMIANFKGTKMNYCSNNSRLH